MRPVLLVVFCLLFTAACGVLPETEERRIPHPGEFAVIHHTDDTEIPVVMTRGDVNAVVRAVETRNTAELQTLIRAGKATLVPAGSRVRVTNESFAEREIRVMDGDHAELVGWVPFEWLKYAPEHH